MDNAREASSNGDHDIKMEDAPANVKSVEGKPTYKSWKKKYRKMRIVFDQKMHECEDLYKLEQKALDTARRLAIENDRLLDLLVDVNNSAQIPPEKRFDLALDLPSDPELVLDVDKPSSAPHDSESQPGKTLKDLLRDVPHVPYASARESFSQQLDDLQAGRDSPADLSQGQSHPPTFLTADDIDNYIWDIDQRLANAEPPPPPSTKRRGGTSSNGTANGARAVSSPAPPAKHAGRALSPLPTLAPHAQPNARSAAAQSSRDGALRNPTSVYNWLRKHAPKTFLQDAEAGGVSASAAAGDKDKDKANGHEDGQDDHHPRQGAGTGSARARRSHGSFAPARKSQARGPRKSAASVALDLHDVDDDVTMDVGSDGDGAGGGGVAGAASAKGKRKRPVDDDPGYRPKGGSSRPTKKKRRSEGGGGETTPVTTPTTAKPARRSVGSTGKQAAAALHRKAQREAKKEKEKEKEKEMRGESEEPKEDDDAAEEKEPVDKAARDEVDVSAE